jgi:hypothetical protein
MAGSLTEEGRKRVLVVLFIPSTDREGRAFPTQAEWVNQALRETNQGEVGLVIGDEYIAIRNLNEE